MSKTIWIINQTAGKPDSGWGERHYYFSKHWIKNGYDIKIISGSFNHLFNNQPAISNKTFTFETLEKGITFCWVKIARYNPKSIFKLWSMIVFSFKILFLPIKKLEKPNVILVSSMPIFSVLPAYILSKRFKSKFIFEVRDLWPETPIHLKGYPKYHPVVIIMSWLQKLGFRNANHIVSVLPNAANYINNISRNDYKYNYIPNGIDIDEVGNEPLSKEIINQIPKNKFIVGYAGTIGLANTMEYFIEASIKMKQNKNIHFVLVGDGYLKEGFKEKTALNNNITFINKIKKSQVQTILGFFDICYVGRYNSPLYKHGVSYNKYFDYMLAKKPILESSALIKDPVELSKCGIIVEPEDSKAIEEGVLIFLNMSNEERLKIGLKGYDYAIKYHSFEYLSKKYIKLFN